MCTSAPKVDNPATLPMTPILPPNLLTLSTGAQEQLAGQGTTVSSLRIPVGRQRNVNTAERIRTNAG